MSTDPDTRSGLSSPTDIYKALEKLREDEDSDVIGSEEADDLELALLRDLSEIMATTYMVEFGGGYEPPSHTFKVTSSEAWKQAEEWAKDMNADEGDYVDVVRMNWATGSCERLYR